MEIIKELRELNLDDNEIKIYLSCLTLGSGKVSDISSKSKLVRTTCYGVLKSLIEKGLISKVLRDNITHYQAVSPNQLIEILDEKKKRIQSILTKLETIQNYTPIQNKIELFEGKEGLKTIINDLTSRPDETLRIIGSYQRWHDFFYTYSDIYYRKKKEKNIKTLALIDEKEIKISKNDKIKNSKIRTLRNLDSSSGCYVYHDKVAFVSYEKDNINGVIIQNQSMHDLQRKIFDKLWEEAK